MSRYQRDLDRITTELDRLQSEFMSLLEAAARDILREDARVESITDAQGCQFIQGVDGREMPLDSFPDYAKLVDGWDAYFGFSPGHIVARSKA